MVVPIGKSANKLSFSNFSNSTTDPLYNISLPTMPSESSIGMVNQTGRVQSNNIEVRGRNTTSSNNSSREQSMVSSGRSTPYCERMDMDLDEDPVTGALSIGSPELSYETEQDKAIRLGKANNPETNTRPTGVHNEATPVNETLEDDVINIQLPYNPQAPTEPELWSGSFHPVSLHGSIEHLASDAKNIKASLNIMAKYIQGKQVDGNRVNDLEDFDGMGDSIWNFISSVYASKWDALFTDNKTNNLRAKISSKFTPRSPSPKGNPKKELPKSVPVTINKAPPPPPLPAKSKNEVNVISKYFQSRKPASSKKNNDSNPPNSQNKRSYAQASSTSPSSSEILKIKEAFPSLNAKKIDQVNNIVNGKVQQKPRLQSTTKGPSRKQIIIPMSSGNISAFMNNSSQHVANINRELKSAKSDILVDYIRSDSVGLLITTNAVGRQSDLSIIDKYIKNSNDVNALQVENSRLPMSKLYLKIIGIPFFPHPNSSEKLTSSDVETVLKQNHIWDNISLASKPRVIKVSPKSDMAIVWIDIWDVQSGKNAKMLINRCFNVGNYIATIRGASMNLGVPQCKNCWKWGHSTFSCCIQGSKCVKCNGPHKSEHHREFGWCCKANDKINPPRLATKKGEPCPHSFKCSNCKGDHQADSNSCPFWRHRFHREWHIRKYAEIRDNRSNSIYSEASGANPQ